MARKRIEQDGKFYRVRKGKLVEIPPEWVGKTPSFQHIRQRASKKGQGRKYKSKTQR